MERPEDYVGPQGEGVRYGREIAEEILASRKRPVTEDRLCELVRVEHNKRIKVTGTRLAVIWECIARSPGGYPVLQSYIGGLFNGVRWAHKAPAERSEDKGED